LEKERAIALAREFYDVSFGEQSLAESVCESADESFVTFAKGLQDGTLAGAFLGVGEAQHASNNTAGGLFGFIELGESAANAEALGIAGINTGDEGTDETIEKLRREFSADEGGDRFVSVEGAAFSEDVANKSPLRLEVD